MKPSSAPMLSSPASFSSSSSRPASLTSKSFSPSSFESSTLDDDTKLFSSRELLQNLLLPKEQVHFRNIFFLNYRSLISPDMLLEHLLKYFVDPSQLISSLPVSDHHSCPSVGSERNNVQVSSSEEKQVGVDMKEPERDTIQQDQQEIQIARLQIQLKVGSALSYWLREYYENDFSPAMCQRLSEFLSQCLAASPSPSPSPSPSVSPLIHSFAPTALSVLRLVKGLLDKRLGHDHDHNDQHESDPEATLAPTRSSPTSSFTSCRLLRSLMDKVKRSGNNNDSATDSARNHKRKQSSSFVEDDFDILSLRPDHVAQVLTLLDFNVFSQITPLQLVDHAWKKIPASSSSSSSSQGSSSAHKKNNTKQRVCLTAAQRFIQRFNAISLWVMSEILARPSLQDRVAVAEFFLDLAFSCRQLNNFHSVFSIISAFTSLPISRLSQLHLMIAQEHKQIKQDLLELTSSANNCQRYREILHTIYKQGDRSTSAIPHMAIIFKDLFFYEEQTFREQKSDKLVDLRRWTKVAELIDLVISFTKRFSGYYQSPESSSSLSSSASNSSNNCCGNNNNNNDKKNNNKNTSQHQFTQILEARISTYSTSVEDDTKHRSNNNDNSLLSPSSGISSTRMKKLTDRQHRELLLKRSYQIEPRTSSSTGVKKGGSALKGTGKGGKNVRTSKLNKVLKTKQRLIHTLMEEEGLFL